MPAILTKKWAYYNDSDPFVCAWARELIKSGLVCPGEVDERPIEEVQATDLSGFTQCHFFCGILGWSYALRLAGWPDDREVWTGSCPCQPYSIASVGDGGAQGPSDERDLWPTWFPLIRERAPSVVLGEQVRSAIGWGWWDRTASDLEIHGYACAPLLLRADAIGADHERKRLYWVADANSAGRKGHQPFDGLSGGAGSALPINGDALVAARRALDGDFRDLLPCDGLSVVMERDALKGYGNAIVPQVAQVFIEAYLSTLGTDGKG